MQLHVGRIGKQSCYAAERTTADVNRVAAQPHVGRTKSCYAAARADVDRGATQAHVGRTKRWYAAARRKN